MPFQRRLSRAQSYDTFNFHQNNLNNKTNNLYRKAIRKVSLQMYTELPLETRQSVQNIIEQVERENRETFFLEEETRTRNFVLTGFKAIKV